MNAKIYIQKKKVEINQNRTLMLQLADGKQINLYKWFYDFEQILSIGLVFCYGLIVMGLFVLQNQMSVSTTNLMLLKDLTLIVLAITPFVFYKDVFYKTTHHYHLLSDTLLSDPKVHLIYMFVSLIWVSIIYYWIGVDLRFLFNQIIPLLTPQNPFLNLSAPLNISITP